MYKEIELSLTEMMWGSQIGCLRQIENLSKNRQPAHGAGTANDWQLHVEGAMGELALAKFLGIYWDGKGKLRAPDVGEVDVRTAGKHNYRLILHKQDPDDRQFWLLTGVNGMYRVHGYIMGHDGKKDKFWSDPNTGRPAYFIPSTELSFDQ